MTERRANEIAMQMAAGLFAIIMLTAVVWMMMVTLLKAFGATE